MLRHWSQLVPNVSTSTSEDIKQHNRHPRTLSNTTYHTDYHSNDGDDDDDFKVRAKTRRERQFYYDVADDEEFSSVQDGIYALGKAHNNALHPVSQKFPQRCL